MGYLLLLASLVVFVLGFERALGLATFLANAEHRRNLLFRIGGFFAMSAWLHALPAILITIYMRREGMLAPEIFAGDEPRATAAALYLFMQVAIVTLALSLGAIAAFVKGHEWQWKNRYTLGGFVLAAALLGSLVEFGALTPLFVLAVSIPFAIYFSLALTTSLEQQIAKFWVPFAVIGVVTAFLFYVDEATHALVKSQLRAFGSGGSRLVTVGRGGDLVMGELVLLTQNSAYLKADFGVGDSPCLVRVPIDRQPMSQLRTHAVDEAGMRQIPMAVFGPWDQAADKASHALADICGALWQKEIGRDFQKKPVKPETAPR